MTEVLQYSKTLLKDATTGSGSVQLWAQHREVSIYVIWSTGVTAGEVVIETADSEDYTGTWAGPLATISFEANKTDVVQITGALRAVRARISTTVVGGTVTVKLYAN
jgi:hypothetical protein